ncbi:serine/threonine-protein kinase [Nocardioides sp. MAHUQ-72]|uniref:serine/threonine-protein kinase n=1 Tax=unclassified Nocardioides TaxID=2615069 RepID=UPI00361FA53E
MAGFPKAGDEYGGRYRILREIGHGGMGIVYEARDTVLNRSVALKIVLPSLPDRDDFQARFAREANVLARIRSRNIVNIHEYGEHDDTVFFVTEFFPDGDLQTWIGAHGPLDRRAALSLVAQVCEALADAHETGVIHRDVKPGNVLLWSRPEGLIPYLCDFGIALEGGESRASLTRTGTLIGSPAYMAPERHFGHAADERGDIYSLGCLLWAVLTGDAPYSGTDFQMMNSHINAPVPQLGTGHPVDDRIDEVLAEALNKDPERRTPSAAAMRAALLAIIRDIDSAAVPPLLPPEPVGPDATARPEPPVAPAAQPESSDRPVEPSAAPAAEQAPAQHTVIRSLPAPPPAPVPDHADSPAPDRKRHWLPAALVAAGAVAAVAVTAVLVTASQGEPDRPEADPGPGSSAEPTATDSTSPAPLDRPAAPKVAASPGYRSVVFTLTAPRATGDDVERRVEVRTPNGWKATDRFALPTDEGGRRGCVSARTVDTDGTGQRATSKPVRSCGTARPRTVRLVRTDDACTAGPGCRWYNVYVEGFATGSSPQAFVYGASGEPWCDCTFRKVRVGKDGRGAQVHEWQVTPGRFNAKVTLVVDGVRQQVFVP